MRLASCCSVEVMNGALGRREYGFCSRRATVNDDSARPLGETARAVLVELERVVVAQLAVRAEVAALRDALAVDRDEPRAEGLRVERRLDVPPLRCAERHPLALALDDEPRRDRLHAAGGEAARDLLPEDGRDLVAVEAVEDAARLLRVTRRSSISRVSPSAC